MIKYDGIKILVRVNRGLQVKDSDPFQRKILGNYEHLLNKVSIDRTFASGSSNNTILTEIIETNQIEQQSIIFTLFNETKDNNIFFHQEENSFAGSLQKEKGIVSMLAESIINQSFGAKVWIKILQFPTFGNITASFGSVDEEGFLETYSHSVIKDLFNFISQNCSEKAMMMVMKGTSVKYNLVYYPNQEQYLVSELCNNFHSQKFVISNYFNLIKPPKFCFFWNILDNFIPDAVKLIMILQSGKGDKTVLQSAKKEMQRLQSTYKRLNQRNRKILNILNKCIDLQNAQIDRKSFLYLDCLPTSEKPSDKLKISAIRKSQNDECIQQLQKDVSHLQSDIASIKHSHKQKMNHHQSILGQKQAQREKLWKTYQSYVNPKVKIDHTNNHNLYWKPVPIKIDKESEQIQDGYNNSATKNAINSHKNITKKNIDNKNMNNELKKKIQFQFQEQDDEKIINGEEKRRQLAKQQETKLQIQSLFRLIGAQEKIIQKALSEHGHQLNTSTINHIKNRQNKLFLSPNVIDECLKKHFSRQSYASWVKQEVCFERFQKQLKQKQMAAQTMTTIRDI